MPNVCAVDSMPRIIIQEINKRLFININDGNKKLQTINFISSESTQFKIKMSLENLFRHATSEEASHRVVVPVKPGNSFANAVSRSLFMNASIDYGFVIPDSDIVIDDHMFTSRECGYTLTRDVLKYGVQGKIAFVIATPSRTWTPAEMVFRMGLVADSLREEGAARVIGLMTEYLFARQDRGAHSYNRGETEEQRVKDRLKHAGQTVTARYVAKVLRAGGVDVLAALHIHSGHYQTIAEDAEKFLRGQQLEAFLASYRNWIFSIPPEPLLARYLQTTDLFADDDKANKGEGIIFVGPDQSAFTFVDTLRVMSGYTNAQRAYIIKERLQPNNPDATRGILQPVGCDTLDYDGKVAFIADDMIDTAGSLQKACAYFPKVRKIVIYATHPILAEQAEGRLRDERLSDLVVMDTRPSRIADLSSPMKAKTTVLSAGDYAAHALTLIAKGMNPQEIYAQAFAENPLLFDRFLRVERSPRHYTRTR